MTAAELKKLRKRLNWSQADAAGKLGCSLRSIVNWEKGTTTIPKSIALAASAVLKDMKPYGKYKPGTSAI